MCDLFTMIIMSRTNYLLVVNDCPKYRGCFACNYVLVNNEHLVCTVSSCPEILFSMTLLITIVYKFQPLFSLK